MNETDVQMVMIQWKSPHYPMIHIPFHGIWWLSDILETQMVSSLNAEFWYAPTWTIHRAWVIHNVTDVDNCHFVDERNEHWTATVMREMSKLLSPVDQSSLSTPEVSKPYLINVNKLVFTKTSKLIFLFSFVKKSIF